MRFALILVAGCGRVGFDAQVDGPPVAEGLAQVALPEGGSVTALAPPYAILGGSRVGKLVNGTWTACGALPTVDLEGLAIDGTDVVVGGYLDVWRSTDRCGTWSSTGFAQHAGAVAGAFAGSDTGLEVLGASWHPVATPLDGGRVRGLQIAGDRLYAVGDRGFAASVDGGVTWAGNSLGGDLARYVAVDPADAQRVAVGGGTFNSLELSTDGGATFAHVAGGGDAVAFDPASAFVAYAQYNYGLSGSGDRGLTFDTTDHRAEAMHRAPTMALAFADGGLYAGTGRGLFFTSDQFATWSELDAGLEAWAIPRLAATGDGTIYLATDADVLTSQDHGATWSNPVIATSWNAAVTSVCLVPGSPDAVIVGTVNAVVRSDDRGQSYDLLYRAAPEDQFVIDDVLVAGSTLVIGTPTGVEVSTAPFATFERHAIGEVRRVTAIAGGFMVATSSGVQASTDGGATFTSLGLDGVSVFQVVTLADGALLAATPSGMWRRAGTQWSASGFDGKVVFSLEVVGEAVYAAAEDGVWRSSDGTTWTYVGLADRAPRSFAVDSGALLVGTQAFGLFRQ